MISLKICLTIFKNILLWGGVPLEEALYNTYQEKIILTKEQQACLNYTGHKTLMVKGLAGAGKSLIIQILAKKLLSEYSSGKKNKVAIFTYSNTLNSATKEVLQINGEKEDYITVTTLTSYIINVYKAINGPKIKIYSDPLYTKIRKEVIQEALDTHQKSFGFHRFHNLELQFWLDEIDWMKSMNVSVDDLNYYLGLSRKGRGNKVRMSASDRLTAFEIYKNYNAIMRRRNIGQWLDLSLYLVHHAAEIPDKYKFDHILIDEAQDFSLVQLMAAMLFYRKDMVIAMDINQRLFNMQWTSKLLGIETTTKKLTKSMRTTKQIDELAESIRKNNDALLDEDDKSLRAVPEKEGPLPQLIHFDDPFAEKKYVIQQIKAWLNQKADITIGIIASKNNQINTFAEWMTDAGIHHEIIRKDSTFSATSSGVKIVNVFNAKGLEFTRVIIPQFIQGNFPFHVHHTDEEEHQLFLSKCRNMIYVAMTRAKFSLLLTYTGQNGSQFIGEMPPNLYKTTGELPFAGADNCKKRINDIIIPPVKMKEKPESGGKDLKTYFQSKGLEVIDKRTAGGCLWIIGEKKQLSPIVKEAEQLYGAYGQFSSGGSATKRRPGWYTKCKK